MLKDYGLNQLKSQMAPTVLVNLRFPATQTLASLSDLNPFKSQMAPTGFEPATPRFLLPYFYLSIAVFLSAVLRV